MTIRAYSEWYLPDAQECLATMIDYAVHVYGFEANSFMELFVKSRTCELFESGNPGVVAGTSGAELAREIGEEFSAFDAGQEIPAPPEQTNTALGEHGSSPEYWGGSMLAEHQWRTGRRFKDILAAVPFSQMVEMYPLFHEMDSLRFSEEVERRILQRAGETNLKWLRENRRLSQARLAELSGVGLRSIQLFEQRVNDINKTQGITLYRLSRVLNCGMEDLLESPSMNALSLEG